MARNSGREMEAERAAGRIWADIIAARPDAESPTTAIVLGTGWGGKLTPESDLWSGPLDKIVGFEGLANLEGIQGHARLLRYRLVGVPVFILDGRIHLNEAPAMPAVHRMVRLQIEMLLKMGVKNLILTCAAGSLDPNVDVGDVVILDGFVTLYGPTVLMGGEFCSPEDTLEPRMMDIAEHRARRDFRVHRGGYAMLRGPRFEGRKYDKPLLAATGAKAVGMSMLPEAEVAALYGVNVLGLAFITNTATEEHSHYENQLRAKARGANLGLLLQEIVARL